MEMDDESAVFEVKINGGLNGSDAAYLSSKLLNSMEPISSPLSTPGGAVELSGSISDATLLPQKDFEHDTYDIKAKNIDSGEILMKSGEQTSDIRDTNDSRRKFRVLGLSFPGKWIMSEKFMDLLAKSESFHIWFDKNAKDGTKQGGLSAVYETPEEAKQAFSTFHKMTFDGIPLKVQASKLFYDFQMQNSRAAQPPIPFKINVSHPDAPRRLYALHLTSATDQTLLSSILGSECIETVQLEADPFIPSEKQAEIVFHSVEEANDARAELAEGFEIDEGDRQLTMRLLTMDEYISYMKAENEKVLNARVVPVSVSASSSNSSQPSPSASSTAVLATSETAVVPFISAPDITVEEVTGFVQQYVDDTRTNWAELNELTELWKLCDEVSQQHKGIPDSLLKIALLNVLEQYQRSVPTHWMRQHVNDLIRTWKKEVHNTKGAQRSTSYTMCATSYVPYDKSKRRYSRLSGGRKRALATIMGVGEVLNKVRTMLATEEGELEVDEDEHGNYTIDGQPLSFDSWANVNKPVEATATYEHPQVFIDPKIRKLRNQRKKEAREKKLEEEKIKKMREAVNTESENENDESSTVDVEANRAETETPEIGRELEEGEMSSESSSSASTSSDEENDDESTSRHRRRKRRRHEKSSQLNSIQAAMGSVNPHFATLFTQLYEQRNTLCRLLSSAHKNAFTSVLGQVLSSPQGMTSAQQNQMNLFIQNFSAQNLPK